MEDLFEAWPSTFPGLESTAVATLWTSTSATQSCNSAEPTRPLEERWDDGEPIGPDRNYVLPSDAGGSYKEEERNVTNDTNHSLCLLQQPLPPKTEDHDAPPPSMPVSRMMTQLPPAIQSLEQWRLQ